MDTRNAPARRSGMNLLEGLYRVVMRRTPIYVTFVVVGAFLAEQAVDKGVHKLWEYNNAGSPWATKDCWYLRNCNSSPMWTKRDEGRTLVIGLETVPRYSSSGYKAIRRVR